MEIKIRKRIALMLCICLCMLPVTAEAKVKKTAGRDGKNISWRYDETSKTLTFSGSGAITDFEMDGHSAEPEWYEWSDKAEHIVIGEGITAVGKMAFYDFMKVETVVLPESLEKIKNDAFNENQRLREINFPANLQMIGAYAFSGCKEMKLPEFPNRLKKIGEYAFCACNKITIFRFPDKVKKVENGILSECELLRTVYLPKKIKTIPEYAFSCSCQLKKIEIPEYLNKVNMSAFIGTGLRKIVLPKGVQVIKNGNHGNMGLGNDSDTKNLRIIEIHSKKVQKIEKNSFGGLSSKVVIKVPESRKKKYTKMLIESGLSKKVKIKSL